MQNVFASTSTLILTIINIFPNIAPVRTHCWRKGFHGACKNTPPRKRSLFVCSEGNYPASTIKAVERHSVKGELREESIQTSCVEIYQEEDHCRQCHLPPLAYLELLRRLSVILWRYSSSMLAEARYLRPGLHASLQSSNIPSTPCAVC